MKRHLFATLSVALAATAIFPAAALTPGEYTVGTGGTYSTMAEAVTALSESELTGAVTFNLAPGRYDEEISIPALAAPVTFKGQDGVIFTNTKEGAEYVFNVSTTNAITFEGIAFEGTPSLTFIYAPTGVETNNLTITNCSFTGGKYGVYTVAKSNKPAITGSTFTDLDVAIYGQGTMLDAVIRDNSFIQHAGLGRTIAYRSLLTVLLSTFDVENNRFNVNLDEKGGHLLDVYSSYTNNYGDVNANPALAHTGIIANNEAIINVPSAPKTIATFLRTGNNVGGFLVANNSVSVTGNAPYSSFLVQQIRDNGQLFYQGNVFTNNIYQNQAGGTFVHILYPGTETFYYYEGMGTNMLCGEGLKDRIWIRSKYDASNRTLGDDITVSSLSDFAVNYGPRTLFANVNFSEGSLMPASWSGIFDKGDARVEITSSINGVARDKYTSMGAYERVLPENLTGEALAGVYSVGTSESDFESIDDAVLALRNRGVKGKVTFSIEDGVYEGTYSIHNVEGLSETNTITFESANESADGVTLLNTMGYSGSTYNTDYPTMPGVIELDGASYITLRNLTIQNQGENFPVLVKLQNSASHVNIEGCQFIQQQTNNSYGNDAFAIFSYNKGLDYNGDAADDKPNHDLSVKDCVFSITTVEGYRGSETGENALKVFNQNSYGQPTLGIRFTGCEVTDYSNPIYLGIAANVIIEGNSFYSHDDNAYFIQTSSIQGIGRIEGNKMVYEQTKSFTYNLEAIGIRTGGYLASATDRMPIVNNEFIVRSLPGTGDNLKAVFIEGSSVVNSLVAHNSVYYTGGFRKSSAFAYCNPISSNTSSCSWHGTEIVNNLFVSESENAVPFVFGYHYSGSPTWDQVMSEATFKHNLAYVPSNNIAIGLVKGAYSEDNNVYMDLNAFNTHVGDRSLNNEMLATMPQFTENSLKPVSFDGIAGKGLANVIDHDIDNNARNAAFSTPGAYEYIIPTGVDDITADEDTAILLNGSTLIAKGFKGESLCIYNLQGELLGVFSITDDYFMAETHLAAGIYIAKTDKSATKIVVK